MPHFQFPAHYVFWTKVNDHDQIKSKYLSKIKRSTSPHNFACTMNSNINDRIDLFGDDQETLRKIVWKPIEDMVQESQGEIFLGDSFIQSHWYNIYESGDFQEKHSHGAYPIVIDGIRYHPSLSIIYILKDDNKEGSTLFTDNNPKPFGAVLDYASLDTSNIEDIGEGSVIVFSSKLEHMVKPVKIGGRITIAFNIFSSFSRTERKPQSTQDKPKC
jgi:predicted 2-oxoglutarate/Fe(II)-dependent dioxygenase YbiX